MISKANWRLDQETIYCIPCRGALDHFRMILNYKNLKKAASRKLQAKKELDKGIMKDYIGDKHDK